MIQIFKAKRPGLLPSFLCRALFTSYPKSAGVATLPLPVHSTGRRQIGQQGIGRTGIATTFGKQVLLDLSKDRRVSRVGVKVSRQDISPQTPLTLLRGRLPGTGMPIKRVKVVCLLPTGENSTRGRVSTNAGVGGGTLLDKIHNRFSISCKESRIETNASFYGCFYLGPFEQGESVTIANALRRTLLADLMGVAITSVEIEGAVHEYASLTGVRESVLDIILNLKEVILKQTTLSSSTTFTPKGEMLGSPLTADKKKVMLNQPKANYLERKKWVGQVGYLRARGPGVIRASDLKLPPYIVCIDPEQYIATLSDDGVLNMKFFISEGKNYLIQVPNKNVHLNELKRRRLFQKKMKKGNSPSEEGVSNSFVRYAPLEITSDSLPLRNPTLFNPTLPLLQISRGRRQVGKEGLIGRPDSTIANSKGLVGVKSFFNLRKQKEVFNDASNGNRLPIDAVFMPVTKVNYIIEPDEQSNDEPFNDAPALNQALPADLGTTTAPLLPLTPGEVLAGGSLKRRSEAEQRAFSSLLVNPLLKTQPPSLFLKHPFNGAVKMRSAGSTLALRHIAETHNRKGQEGVTSPSFTPPSLDTTVQSLGTEVKGRGSRDVNLTFLHSAPFLTTEALKDGYEAKQPQVIFKGKSQQKLRVSDSTNQPVVGQDVFTKKNPLKFKIILEIWTNGSIHPRKALYDSFKSMITLFSRLQKVQILGSMLKSERFYKKLIENRFNTKNASLASQAFFTPNLTSVRKKPLLPLLSVPLDPTVLGSSLMVPQGVAISEVGTTSSAVVSKKRRGTGKGKGETSGNSPSSTLPIVDCDMGVEPLPKHSQGGGFLATLPPVGKPEGVEANLVQGDILKPVSGMASGKIKARGLYSLHKTITGLQTSLPEAGVGLQTEPEGSAFTPPPTLVSTVGTTLGKSKKTKGINSAGLGRLDSDKSGGDTLSDVHLITLESLNLSLRSYTCLKRSKINTVHDLMGYSKIQLIKIKNLGLHSLEEIQTCLGGFGLKLKLKQ